jgi:GAF domain-containing protein
MSDAEGAPRQEAFPHLSVPVLNEDSSLRDALRRIAVLGHHAVPSCGGASITLIERGRTVTMGSSNDLALELDTAQYQAGDGPCLTAARELRTISVEDMSADDRWAEFERASERAGICSSLSLPMMLGGELKGGFNLYGTDVGAFGREDVQLGTAFASQATAVVLNAQAYWAAADLSRNLATALETRGVIERAKGVLMANLGLTADEAFDELRKRSQQQNRKLNELAVEITDEATPRR